MAQLIQVRLSRHDAQPWGFRLSGGKDFGTPLVVQKVAGGSLADKAGLIPGDAVVKVNDFDVFSLRHKDAQDIIVRSGNCFDLTLQRGGSTWRPHVTATGSLPTPSSQLGHIAPVTRTSLAHKPQEVRHIGSGYNNSARPYGGINGTDGHVKSIVNKQYNSPVGIYSEEAIAETLSAQAEVLAGGVLGVNFKKNEKIYNAANSEVLKMLHEQENDPEPDEQDPYQSTLQHSPRPRFEQEQPHYNTNPSVTKHVTAPVARPNVPNTGGIPAGQNICTECERLIVGVFVRVKDKNLHVDCFKCATCGTSLKNQGYFNFNNKLYCDIHAKMAAMKNPPAGTEGYVPVPIKANQKLSASTISAALDSVGVHANGTAPPSHVHSGYGGPKPFNAGGPLSPHSGGPRSPSSYPPPAPNQAPSWAQPKPAPKPAVNPYATLPRTGGRYTQYKPAYNTFNRGNTNIPIPPPPPLPKPSEAEATARLVKPSEVKNEFEKKASPYRAGEATQMLAKSLERVNVSNKEKFNNHAGQIISNMLEKRLAAANNQIASNGINGSPNAVNVKNTYNATVKVTPPPAPVEPKSLSAHSLKKVTDLSDKPPNPPPFPIETKVSPTHSVKKVLEISAKPPNPPPFPIELKSSPQHPMKKILDLCEKPAPLDTNDNSLTLPNANSSQRVLTTATVIISPPPPPPVEKTPETITTTDTASPSDLNSETVVYRNKPKNQLTTHAVDRRSYIEKDGRRESLHESNEAGNGVEEVQTTTMAEELKDGKQPVCCQCNARITRGPFITALGRIWCPDHFICVNGNCRRALQDIGFVEEKGDLYCEYCFEKYLAPTCSKCSSKIKGDCLNAIGKHFHPECFTCVYCGKLFGNSPFFLEEGEPYCEADWNELFTTKCFACGFPVEAGDKWVEALNHNYHSQCFNCTYCKKNLEGQSFYNKGGRPFCKNHAR